MRATRSWCPAGQFDYMKRLITTVFLCLMAVAARGQGQFHFYPFHNIQFKDASGVPLSGPDPPSLP